MLLKLRWLSLLVGMLLLAACDPMAPQPTPVAVVISPLPSATATERPTSTPSPTPTPAPTQTPFVQPTPTAFPCDEDTGRIESFNTFPSAVAGGENLRYLVYVPPCYVETQARFPVVYLLHGLSYREQQWEDIGAITALEQGIRLGVLPPMILVMPYFGTLGQRNSFPPDASYETHILEELIPAVESQFCVWEDRAYRAIGGISRGGFWAYSIALRNPDVFGAVGGHSAFFPNDPREVPPAFDPVSIATNSSLLTEVDLRMYLDNAAADSAGLSQQRLSDRLRERRIPHTYVINPLGEHNNDYWSAYVSEYLEFYGRDWPRSYDALPSCAS
ncbi:MAG: alpha/beta hydrolase [Chloroflexota bacterium]